MNNETQPATLTPLQRFWRLLRPDQREIRNVYVYAIFNGLINLSLPLGIQAIVNLIQGGQMSTSWMVLTIIVVLGVIITGVLQVFQLRIVENLQQKIFARAAFEFAYRIPRVRMEALYRSYAPELMNRFFDTMSIQKGLSKVLIDFSAAILQVIFGLILLSLYHPFFILFSFALVLFVLLVFRLTANPGLRASLRESKHKYQVAYWLEELARTANTFRLAGPTSLPLQKTDERVGKYLEARESHFRVLVRQYSLLIAFKALIVAGLLAIGGILVMEQLMNIGQFVAAEIIILLIINSVDKLFGSIETIYDVLTGLEKIGQVTDLELEQKEGVDLSEECQDQPLRIELMNATFAYPGQKNSILDELNLKVEAGERLMITGPNGAGKSTLLHVIAGLFDLQEGVISYQGLPKGSLDPDSLRAVIADCLSQEQLFEGTVMDNITMGLPHVTFDRVKWAVANLDLGDFIKRLPQGYDTLLDPLGKNLPRGVTQLLLIARCIARKPKLLLLEHALEHVTPDKRKQVVDFLTDERHDWTLVAVSSDSYLAQHMDRIAIMQDGKIAQYGNYEDVKDIAYLNSTDHA